MTITINGTTGITTPEITLDNTAADGGQVVLKSSGYSNWNIDNYSGRLRGYYGSTEYWTVDASGNFGIGTSAQTAKLDISGGGDGLQMRLQRTSDAGFVLSETTGNTNWKVKNSGGGIYFQYSATAYDSGYSTKVGIDSSGNLLVGTTSTGPFTGRVTLSGDSGTTKWSVGPYSGNASGFMVCANASYGVYLPATTSTSWATASDERIKTALEPIENAAEKVSTLRAVTGKYKADENGPRKPFLIAQDVLAVFPEAVDTSNPERYGIAYSEMIPLLVAAIKEQQAIINQLQADVAALKGQA